MAHAQSSMHEFPRDQSLFFPYTSWIDVVILIPGESYKNSSKIKKGKDLISKQFDLKYQTLQKMKGAMNCMIYPPQSPEESELFYGPVQCPDIVHQQINIAQVLIYEETFITQ